MVVVVVHRDDRHAAAHGLVDEAWQPVIVRDEALVADLAYGAVEPVVEFGVKIVEETAGVAAEGVVAPEAPGLEQGDGVQRDVAPHEGLAGGVDPGRAQGVVGNPSHQEPVLAGLSDPRTP